MLHVTASYLTSSRLKLYITSADTVETLAKQYHMKMRTMLSNSIEVLDDSGRFLEKETKSFREEINKLEHASSLRMR